MVMDGFRCCACHVELTPIKRVAIAVGVPVVVVAIAISHRHWLMLQSSIAYVKVHRTCRGSGPRRSARSVYLY